MSQFGWSTCRPPVRQQVERVVSATQAILGPALVGVYLHGSLAMNCFNPARSDLDLLVVTESELSRAQRLALARLLLATSNQPTPIEISVLARTQLVPWRHPTPFDLHFGEAWRERTEAALAADDPQVGRFGHEADGDLAAHVTITRTRGVTLAGAPIAAVFPSVPPQDYRASILSDVRWALAGLDENPTYTLLNLCRVLAYEREGAILSKDEGAQWALPRLPEPLRPTLAFHLAAYRGAPPGATPSIEAARSLADHLMGQIEQPSCEASNVKGK